MSKKWDLIARIVDIELEMFLSVRADGKYSCQEHPDMFRLHRRAQFSAWSEDTLTSYLNTLERAKDEGANLMAVKYAIMEGLIPRENLNPIIDKIVATQYKWQMEMFNKYPCLMAGARPMSQSEDSDNNTSFETYLKGELDTYSDNTLSLLYRDITEKEKKGSNMSEEVYEYLVKELGYKSIEHAEESQKRRSPDCS